jgi:hypothetical protein
MLNVVDPLPQKCLISPKNVCNCLEYVTGGKIYVTGERIAVLHTLVHCTERTLFVTTDDLNVFASSSMNMVRHKECCITRWASQFIWIHILCDFKYIRPGLRTVSKLSMQDDVCSGT